MFLRHIGKKTGDRVGGGGERGEGEERKNDKILVIYIYIIKLEGRAEEFL